MQNKYSYVLMLYISTTNSRNVNLDACWYAGDDILIIMKKIICGLGIEPESSKAT